MIACSTSTFLQRRSAFPPLLSGSDKQRENGASDSKRAPPATSNERETQIRPSKPVKKTAIPARNKVWSERDDEHRKNRQIKAEALVRKWDCLLQREKQDRHARLLERLDLQHRLIAKTDLAFRQSLRDAEQKRAQEIQARRDHQKKMIRDLRAHALRVNEHKKMVAEKMKKRQKSITDHPDRAVSPELSHLHCQTEEEEDGEYADSRGGPQRDEFDIDVGHTSRLQQLLNFDPIREATPTISSAWVMLKRDHSRKLRPVLEYSLHTRESANPTLRTLLQYYDEPTRVNSRNAERVGLSELFEKECERRRARLGGGSVLTHTLEQRTRTHQTRAEVLIHRKQAEVELPIQEPTMYLPSEEYGYLNPHEHHLPPPTVESDRAAGSSSQTIASGKTRREVGALIPESPQNGQKRIEAAFITDQSQEDTSNPAEREDSVSAAVRAKVHKPRWQPLSTTAVQEYRGTRVVPVKVSSSGGHGSYSLWKPLTSCTHNQQNSSPVNE